MCLTRPTLTTDKDGLIIPGVEKPLISLRDHLKYVWCVIPRHVISRYLRCIETKILKWIDRDEYPSSVGIDGLIIIAPVNSFQYRGFMKVRNVYKVVDFCWINVVTFLETSRSFRVVDGYPVTSGENPY
jgi:hypothetical protein